jgi:hypothetical protein
MPTEASIRIRLYASMKAWIACIVAVSPLASASVGSAPPVKQQRVEFKKGETGTTPHVSPDAPVRGA